jgi:hypothetical protein
MKKLIITSTLALCITILLTQCCKKTGTTDACTYSTDFVGLTFPFSDTGATTIPAFINFVPTGIYIPSVYSQTVRSTVDSQVKANGQYKTCQAKEIYMESMRVKIDSPANQNFDFISTINLYIAKKGAADSILVASKTAVPAGSKSIIMDITPNINIKDYVLQDSFKFIIGATKSSGAVLNTTDKTYLRFDAAFKGKIFTK